MIVVSGLRRSGTSMLMFALKEAGFKIAGIEFADDVDDKRREGNPNGYWELDKITKHTGLQTPIEGDVVKIMFEALPLSRPHLIDKVLIICRNPQKVLYSVQKHNSIKRDLYIVKALLDTVDVLEFTRFIQRKIVCYEDIIKRPLKEMKAICEFLGEGDAKKASKTITKKLNRSKNEHDTTENMDLWEKFYYLLQQNKTDEVISYKEYLENEAIRLDKIICAKCKKQIKTRDFTMIGGQKELKYFHTKC